MLKLSAETKKIFTKYGLEGVIIGKPNNYGGIWFILEKCRKPIIPLTDVVNRSRLTKSEREIIINDYLIPYLDLNSKDLKEYLEQKVKFEELKEHIVEDMDIDGELRDELDKNLTVETSFSLNLGKSMHDIGKLSVRINTAEVYRTRVVFECTECMREPIVYISGNGITVTELTELNKIVSPMIVNAFSRNLKGLADLYKLHKDISKLSEKLSKGC
jgi:hypothetical protein